MSCNESYVIKDRPSDSPPLTQALVKIGLAKCYAWFDHGVLTIDEVSWIHRILLRLPSAFDIFFLPKGFHIEILELYDSEFSRYIDAINEVEYDEW